jgi:hypothetical protein
LTAVVSSALTEAFGAATEKILPSTLSGVRGWAASRSARTPVRVEVAVAEGCEAIDAERLRSGRANTSSKPKNEHRGSMHLSLCMNKVIT